MWSVGPARMQKEKLRDAICSSSVARNESIEIKGAVGARQQKNSISLPTTKICPRTVRRITPIENEVMAGFDSVQPLRGAGAVGGLKNGGFVPHMVQLIGDLMGNPFPFQVILKRRNRHCLAIARSS